MSTSCSRTIDISLVLDFVSSLGVQMNANLAPSVEPIAGTLLSPTQLAFVGVWGLINSRNAVRVLMSIELMLNAVNINLMAFSSYVDGDLIRGQVFAVFVITVAAAEAAVGLAILLSLYRNRVTVDMEQFNLLRW